MNQEKFTNRFWSSFYDNGVYYLAVSVCFYLLVLPFIERKEVFDIAFLVLSTLILSGTLAFLPRKQKASKSRWTLLLILALPWLMRFDDYLNTAILFSFFLMFSFTSYRITQQIFNEKEVDLRVITGSIVGYLLVGISFTFLCAILVKFYPNSYASSNELQSAYSFIYYSFITLSTLGYGDITPKTSPAQALAVLITVTGQFYMVVVVAAIVGKYIAKR